MDVAERPIAQDKQYRLAALEFSEAIGRLAYAYEYDVDKRQDLIQDIHFELWRSFKIFDGRSSLRTWVYRIAHNTGASHVLKQKRISSKTYLNIDDMKELTDKVDYEAAFERIDQLDKLMALIQRLKPTDRQIITLYLEGLNASEIGEVAGLSSGAIATKIHRIKSKLTTLFQKGDIHVEQ